MTVTRTVPEAIQSHEVILAIYDRVHSELDEGKEWAEIDNGFREEDAGVSYDHWLAYTRQRLINGLRDIVLTYRHGKQ